MIIIVLNDEATFAPANECFVVNIPSDIKEEDIEQWLSTDEAKAARVFISPTAIRGGDEELFDGDLFVSQEMIDADSKDNRKES